MKRLGFTLISGLVSLALLGCPATTPANSTTPPPTSNPDTNAEFELLNKKLDALKVELAQLKALMTKEKPSQDAAAIARIGRRMARIEQVVTRIRTSRPRRSVGPDNSTVYSVPIAGSASSGPRHALVTVVQAFEFA